QLPRLGRIQDVLERPRNQHLPDRRVARRGLRHLVQQREAAADGASGGAVLLDGARQVFTKARVEEVVVVADLEAGFGEEIGEIPFQVRVETLKAGPRVAVSRHFARLHFTCNTSLAADGRGGAHGGAEHHAMQGPASWNTSLACSRDSSPRPRSCAAGWLVTTRAPRVLVGFHKRRTAPGSTCSTVNIAKARPSPPPAACALRDGRRSPRAPRTAPAVTPTRGPGAWWRPTPACSSATGRHPPFSTPGRRRTGAPPPGGR